MEEKVHMDSDMAQRGRIPIDVTDLKDEVENCRTDAAWAELSLAAKIRVLVKERLEQLKTEAPSPSKGKGDTEN